MTKYYWFYFGKKREKHKTKLSFAKWKCNILIGKITKASVSSMDSFALSLCLASNPTLKNAMNCCNVKCSLSAIWLNPALKRSGRFSAVSSSGFLKMSSNSSEVTGFPDPVRSDTVGAAEINCIWNTQNKMDLRIFCCCFRFFYQIKKLTFKPQTTQTAKIINLFIFVVISLQIPLFFHKNTLDAVKDKTCLSTEKCSGLNTFLF